ncbi:MAG: restriction endonuclease [Bacteroidales bacterium]|nr:restriction endonuclease [Bacteroidales bacterium]
MKVHNIDNQNFLKNDIIFVKKASGEEEPFAVDKLKNSLRNAGADNKIIEKIVADIEEWIYAGATTRKIYSRAFAILHRERTIAAIRYKLKQAIMELGPTGYPFEHFIGRLFEKQGFNVEVGVTVAGNCVTHEMDVIATSGNIQYLIECKYSIDQGKQVSVQVPLYVRSRIDDIIRKRKETNEYNGFSFSGWVVTNTRFSADSIQYGNCSGLHLLAWDHPSGNGIKDIIAKEKIYPITILNNITRKEKQDLINQGIVTCSQLLHNPESLNNFEINRKKYKTLMEELHDICS